MEAMSLDPSKLENVVARPDGAMVARCPACAEERMDTKGEHLIVFKDGRFGCAVYPGDHEHRKLIWALAGGGDGGVTPTILPRRVDISKLGGMGG